MWYGVEFGFLCFFFFKQKTAYEIYQCDWSSDVCSSDLAGTTRVLELKESEQSFIFINVSEKQVPSILRNFSAPVELESDLTENDLAFLAAHDSDAFNRWDAGQRLATGCMLSLISDYQQNKKLKRSEEHTSELQSH